MAFDFIVLGATGMQGKIVSRDLLEQGYSVLLCGRDKSRVEHFLRKYPKSRFAYFSVQDRNEMRNVIKKSGAKVLINCVEGDWNDKILEVCIEAGVHSVDLGSDIPMTKVQFVMDKDLKKKNLTHITGCGSVPGIGNVMLKHATDKFDKIDDIEVGFAWDSNIKKFVVPFSIQSITEEFVHPADMVINHKNVTMKPSDTVVRCYHKAIEKERCFNVGHHPETFTFYEFCKRKGVKNVKFFAGFPDHSYDVIKTLVELGLSSPEPIDFRGQKIAPVNFLTAVLKNLEIPKGYKETENLWVEIWGKKSGKNKHIKMECIVPTLKGWEDAGCNVDTGMPASIMAQMIFNDEITERGSFSPEFVVPVESFFNKIAKKKMIVYENGKRIN